MKKDRVSAMIKKLRKLHEDKGNNHLHCPGLYNSLLESMIRGLLARGWTIEPPK